MGSAATAANDSVEATGASVTIDAVSGTAAAVGWCGTADSNRTAAAVLRRPELDRTSAALTGRLSPSEVRRTLAGSGDELSGPGRWSREAGGSPSPDPVALGDQLG
ncbi:hypothetical protein GCM10028790_38720 [Micromonospora taraxaci]